jgi:tetratricopeptide (TPR) repeat protein
MRKIVSGGALAALLALSQTGCMTQLAANSTVRIMGRAAPALQTQADPGIAEAALPYSIAQMEGLLLVVPNNGALRLQAMRAYGSYGFGFLEDRMEQAEVDDDEARIEHYRERATAAYLRAKALGLEELTRQEDGDDGASGALRRAQEHQEAWTEYLSRFDDEDQAPVLFWTAYAWGRYINLHKDDVTAIADLPYVVALFQRAMALDPTFNFYAGYAALGAYHAGRPAALGGQPEEALRNFDRAIELTHGNFLMYKVFKARLYAVMVQDRALFQRLLTEVLEAGDVMPEQRLANQLAKRRARRYLDQIDALFLPQEPGVGGETPAEAPAAPTAPAESPATPAETPTPVG